jgi:hypothetical protein
MKKIAAVLLVLVAVIGGALFWLTGNIDGLVKKAVENYGSAMTQARVSVGTVKIAPADGKGTIGDLIVGNPAGFKTTHALKVARIDIDVDIASIAKDVVVIHRIAVLAPDVIYEKGETMTNFDAIQKNISAYLGPATSQKDGKKLIVEQLTIRDAKAEASAAFMNGKAISVPLPDITLQNLGRAKGGISPGELGQEVAGALKAKLTGAVSFDRLMQSAGEALGKAGSAIKGLFK